MDLLEDFKNAMILRGLIAPTNLIADGQFHRCDANRPRGNNDGSYLLKNEVDYSFGIIQIWSDGQNHSFWFSKKSGGITSKRPHNSDYQ
jgi:hypothetical protein